MHQPDFPSFPRGFRFATATSAFQIEGGRFADDRGRCIWDDWVDTPGAVVDASTADPGADSYHRWREDIALAAGLGVDRYRFSISWVRVQPEVGGPASIAGLDYYSKLVDGLLEAGVTPFPSLYHWDLPVTLEAGGGWLDRDTAQRFSDYVQFVADHLGDRVRHWYTINEPASTTLQGYGIGTLAPGRQLLFDALPTVHHQLLAHGYAAEVLRDAGAETVAIANNHTLAMPLTDATADYGAAGLYDALHNRMFADPLLTGTYPDLAAFGLPDMPVLYDDMARISAPLDLYGINFYNPTTVRASVGDETGIPFDLVPTPGAPVTGFGEEWPIVPAALTDLLRLFQARYGEALPPIAIAENGASFPEPDRAGFVQDDERIAYLDGHVRAVIAAIADGVVVREYTVWSLLDNFEWADGFTQRFGLVHVDTESGERTPKASYDWYRALIAQARAS